MWCGLVSKHEQGHDKKEEQGHWRVGVGRVAQVALAEAHELPLVVLLHVSAPLLVVTWRSLQALTFCRDSKVVVAEIFVPAL